MTFYKIIQVLLVVFLMSAGQILFKKASTAMQAESTFWNNLLHLSTNPSMIVGVVIYGITTILWVLILKETELNKAYPFMALNFFLVPLASAIFFKESITLGLLIGSAFIMLGILLIYLL